MDDLIADAMIDDIKNADMPEHCKHNRLTWINKHRSKPAEWSDKDEAMITLLHNIIDHHYSMDIIKKEKQLELEDWLKSLKDRVRQKPKQEWSEADENHVKSILSTIECCKAQFQNSPAVVEAYNADVEWLNSLRPQHTWKPSDEQMNTLEYYMHTLICNEHKEVLFELYTDLKKLKEDKIMKANAPEKIYLVIDPVWGSMSVNYNRNDTNNIEYVRADAFIEKADKFISTFFHPDNKELIDAVLKEFHKYMEGE